jgi:uncharacterized protein
MTHWPLLLLGGWLAATISGAAGFGGALLLLPALTYTVGPKTAAAALTLAQLLGNLSRAGFGFRDIHWRPALLFSVGALPASVLGARLMVALPSQLVARTIGVFLLLMVVYRHTSWGTRPLPTRLLPPAGAGVGFLSALVGSAGPLGAAVFLSLHLPPGAYVASEAVTATLMHMTKSLVYGRYLALTASEVGLGLALGGTMVLGSFSGRRLVTRLSAVRFTMLVEGLLIIVALSLIIS